MTPDDADTVRRLQTHLREPSPRLVELATTTGNGLVSVADGDVVGYVLPVGRATVHVAELVVAPAYRRQGRARRLLVSLQQQVVSGQASGSGEAERVSDSSATHGVSDSSATHGVSDSSATEGANESALPEQPASGREGTGGFPAADSVRAPTTEPTARVTLFVHPDNDAARSLYDAVGFERIGRRPDFYADADALVLGWSPE